MKSLTIPEALDYCGISRSCLSRWEAKGLIHRKIRGSDEAIVFSKAELDKALLSKPKRGRRPKRK